MGVLRRCPQRPSRPLLTAALFGLALAGPAVAEEPAFEAAPAFGAAEKVRSGLRWAKAHPEWLAGIGVALLVARPRAFFRWAKRGFFVWRSLHRLRGAVESILPAR